jgi:hypothetical protein
MAGNARIGSRVGALVGGSKAELEEQKRGGAEGDACDPRLGDKTGN